MDVEASLDLSIGQKCGGGLSCYHKAEIAGSIGPTALGGHAWLIELQAPHPCRRNIIAFLSPRSHRILRGDSGKDGETAEQGECRLSLTMLIGVVDLVGSELRGHSDPPRCTCFQDLDQR